MLNKVSLFIITSSLRVNFSWHFLLLKALHLPSNFCPDISLVCGTKKQHNTFAFQSKLTSSYETESYKLCIQFCLVYVRYKLIDSSLAQREQMSLKQWLVSVPFWILFWTCVLCLLNKPGEKQIFLVFMWINYIIVFFHVNFPFQVNKILHC